MADELPGKRPAADQKKPPLSAQMSTPDMSQFANQVDIPQRSGETWVAIAVIVILAFSIGIFFALR